MWSYLYEWLVFLAIAMLGVYDVCTKRAPDKALVFILPFALLSPAVRLWAQGANVAQAASFAPLLLSSLLGAGLGFAVLLGAALASRDGNGVGGGDVKLAAILGFVYGSAGIIGILLVASLTALPVGLYCRKKSGGEALSLPFVPFMAIGCLAITIVKFLSIK